MRNGTLSARRGSATAALAGKHLTFRLGGDSFGIPVLHVAEIRRIQSYSPLDGAPDHFRGSINSRGRVAPVIDLRQRLGLDQEASTGPDCVVVIDVPQPDGDSVLMGLVVDVLEGIISVADDDLEEVVADPEGLDSVWLRAVVNTHGKSTLLLNLEQLGQSHQQELVGAA